MKMKTFRGVLKHDPILNCLVSYLTPLDWVCLTKAVLLARPNFPFQVILNQLAYKQLLKNLTEYFGGHKGVAKFILNHLGTYYGITGGFLLAAITGDRHFLERDLDIVHKIHKRVGPALEDELVQRGWMTSRAPDTSRRYQFRNLASVKDYTMFGKHFQMLCCTFMTTKDLCRTLILPFVETTTAIRADY